MVHRDRVDTETAIIDDVVAGRYDMGWVAQRPWHARGVDAFDALVAPFLVDSYPLEAAVLGDPIVDDMLAGLEGTGVVGLGIVAGSDPVRRDARRGVRCGRRAHGTDGRDRRHVRSPRTPRRRSAGPRRGSSSVGRSGTRTPSSQQLGAIYGNRYDQQLPNVSGLGLWPRPLIVVIGKAALRAPCRATSAPGWTKGSRPPLPTGSETCRRRTRPRSRACARTAPPSRPPTLRSAPPSSRRSGQSTIASLPTR